MRILVTNDDGIHAEGLDVCFVGVPFDLGTSNRTGARFGPHAIRHASRMLSLNDVFNEDELKSWMERITKLLPEGTKLDYFADLVPTTENLVILIYNILQRGFSKAHLEKVRIEESMMNSFEYAGEGSAPR